VVNPSALEGTVRRLLETANREWQSSGSAQQATLGQETANGRVWSTLGWSNSPNVLYWTYDRGYLVAAMDRGLAARAIATRESGGSLIHSASFRQRTLLQSRDPSLIVVNGETERIRAASRTRLTSLILDLIVTGGAGHAARSGSAP
jgi:hypothetical protein